MKPSDAHTEKVNKFLDEFDRLSKHFQLQFSAKLEYSPQGIFPRLLLVDRLPDPFPPSENVNPPTENVAASETTEPNPTPAETQPVEEGVK